ncbi:DNA-methyltransferase [Segatella salivae]|uniref:Methyltransferase n=1 Tax=Segatella salivae F0493 TaxID=1395125 RepID=U2LD98_9BACT|nr:site-specific DNA-methyltransferase [Segatella salivae]ERK02281.1 DNA methylase family protein [Segatella salivae F0493]
MTEKARANRNRTLTIAENEITTLEKAIINADDLKKSFADNSVINADLFDCLDAIPNDYFHLIIIDPPYNLAKDFHGNKFSKLNTTSYEAYLRSWFGKVCDKLAPNGTLYMCGDWQCSLSMQKVISEQLTILNRITWQREKGRGAKANWKNAMEDIWFAVKNPKDYYFDVEAVKMKRKVIAPYKVDGKPKDWEQTESGNFRITYPSNFWDDISIPFWSMPENTDHPTQKPEKLYAKLILASTKPGDKVFDPFLGSGTSAVVAYKLNRNYVGIELNRDYCLWAAKRLMNATKNKVIQGYSDNVFWERNALNSREVKKKRTP